jgi:hypothetical protein
LNYSHLDDTYATQFSPRGDRQFYEAGNGQKAQQQSAEPIVAVLFAHFLLHASVCIMI